MASIDVGDTTSQSNETINLYYSDLFEKSWFSNERFLLEYISIHAPFVDSFPFGCHSQSNSQNKNGVRLLSEKLEHLVSNEPGGIFLSDLMTKESTRHRWLLHFDQLLNFTKQQQIKRDGDSDMIIPVVLDSFGIACLIFESPQTAWFIHESKISTIAPKSKRRGLKDEARRASAIIPLNQLAIGLCKRASTLCATNYNLTLSNKNITVALARIWIQSRFIACANFIREALTHDKQIQRNVISHVGNKMSSKMSSKLAELFKMADDGSLAFPLDPAYFISRFDAIKKFNLSTDNVLDTASWRHIWRQLTDFCKLEITPNIPPPGPQSSQPPNSAAQV